MSAVFESKSGGRETVGCDIYKVSDSVYTDAAKSFIGKVGKLKSIAAEQAADMANEYKTQGDKYLAVSRGEPHGLAGLMILSRQGGALKIEAVCAHPLSKTVGLQLVQHAVNASQKSGNGGRLVLTDRSNGNSLYTNIGFTPVSDEPGEIKMKLDPATSSNWMTDKRGRYVARR